MNDRSVQELIWALRERATFISGQKWEAPATAEMMREAADRLCEVVTERGRLYDAFRIECEKVELRDKPLLAEADARASQLIADLLNEYADELRSGACDNCEECGPNIMCRFHSLLSALAGRTWTTPACERAGAGVSQWRPIATAPKHEEILVWESPWKTGLVGRFSDIAGWQGALGMSISPTHWMSLPAPPKRTITGAAPTPEPPQ